jgi:hypothetical protein
MIGLTLTIYRGGGLGRTHGWTNNIFELRFHGKVLGSLNAAKKKNVEGLFTAFELTKSPNQSEVNEFCDSEPRGKMELLKPPFSFQYLAVLHI